MAKYESVKKELYKFMNENKEMKTNDIANRFIGPLAKRRSVYRWIQQHRETGTLERKIATGRPTKIATKGNVKKIEKMFNHRSGRSQNAAARKLGCTQQYIS